MKHSLLQWMFRLTVTLLFFAGILVIIVLYPVLSYANETMHKNYTIYHCKPLDSVVKVQLEEATALVATSEYYDSKLLFNICLHDGSPYPELIQSLRGRAFAWGFYNNVVLMGKADYKNKCVELNGYKWNLTQLLTHEMTHCLQFNRRGFWKSNPVASIPDWKWEGYPEYIARQNDDQKDLSKNIDRLLQTETKDNNGWIQFSDSTGTVIPYYKYWLLIQYCMNVKKMNYTQIINDTTSEEITRQQMMNWYQRTK